MLTTRTVMPVMHISWRITWRWNLMWMMSPPDDLPPPHLLSWMARMPTLVSPQWRHVQGLAIEGHGGKRNKGPGIKNTLWTLTEMRITKLIASCGNTVPLFPGTLSKCLTLNSNQNPPAKDLTGCSSIQRDFSHLTFSSKCGRENCLTTLLMKRINTTRWERIVTDDAVSTLFFIQLYFNDVINIFTKRCSAQRPSQGERGYMGPRAGHYWPYWTYISYLSKFVQKHCEAHTVCSQLCLHFCSICLERHVWQKRTILWGCSAHKPSQGECGYMGPRPSQYSKWTHSLHRVHT